MSSTRQACPECARALVVPEAQLGRKVRCPGCGASIATERPGVEAYYAPPEAPIARGRDEPEVEWDPAQWRIGMMIRRGPAGVHRRWTASQVRPDGLLVYLHGSRPRRVLIRRGGAGARHLGGKKLAVPFEGGEVTLEVMQNGLYEARLARDIARFLEGEGPLPSRGDYRIPRLLLTLYLVPLLVFPLGIALMELDEGREAWTIAMGLVVGSLLLTTGAIVTRERWSLATRFAACLGLDVAAMAAFALFGQAAFRGVMRLL